MDKVKLYPQERLDLGDIQALQELVYQYTQRSLGNLLGGMRGLLSRPVYTFNNGSPDTLSLSDFSFVCTKAEGTDAGSVGVKTLQTSEIVHFNSALTDHGNYPINLTSVTSSMFLWARPLMVDTDTENRRKWDLNTGSEITFSDNVRSSMRVEFAFSATDPTQAGDAYQYSNIAKVTAITGTTITMDFISAFDNPSLQAVNSESGTFYSSLNTESTAFSGALFTYSPSNSSNTYDQGFGLLQVLHLLGKALRLHKYEGTNDPSGTTKTTPWFSTPQLSLNGAYKYLTNHDSDIGDLQVQANTNSSSITRFNNIFFTRGLIPFAWCRVKGNPTYNSNIWTIVTGSFNSIYVDSAFPGIFKLVFTTAQKNEQWYINHVNIQMQSNPSSTGANTKNHKRVTVEPTQYSTTIDDSAWYDASVGSNAIKFEVIPHHLANETNFDARDNSADFNNLANTGDIILDIAFFGAPANA